MHINLAMNIEKMDSMMFGGLPIEMFSYFRYEAHAW